MSISTGRGDSGDTDLLFGRAVRKSGDRVAALGAVDELNAALGLVRAVAVAENARIPVPSLGDPGGGTGGEGDGEALAAVIERLQRELIALMGELSALPGDRARYCRAGMPTLGGDSVAFLDALVKVLEAGGVPAGLRGWALPGAEGSLLAAHLDHARTVCRRAEHTVWRVVDAVVDDSDQTGGGFPRDGEVPEQAPVFLNRLSDVLWLMARAVASASAE